MSAPFPSQNQGNELQDVSVNGSSNTITFAPVQTTIETQILQISPREITQRQLIWHSPYQGLKRFNTKDRHRFFGRDKLIQTILEAINSNRLTLVTGASGSGKSSVVRAGAIPELRKSLGNQQFYDFIFTPGENPFASLYRCLLNEEKDYQFSESEAKIALKPEVDTLQNVVEQLKSPQSRWLLFVDQFEELFTNCGEEEIRQKFLQGLVDLIVNADDTLRVVLGMRADFQEFFSHYQGWSQLINQNSYLFVGEMSSEELRQAIEQPAAQHGVVFEEGLVKQIIDDVQGQKGYLPLLQYTLDLLWKQECETQKANGQPRLEDRVLASQTYWDLQGVRGALKTRVEQIYQQISWEQQEATKCILLKLVNIIPSEGGDRVVSRKAYRHEFAEGTTSETLQQLINENLLVSSLEYEDRETSPSMSPGMAADRSRQQGAIVELAHEILLVSWDRLKQWIEQEKEAIALKNFLADETQRWQRVREERGEKQAREELLQGTRLEQIETLRQEATFEQVGGLRKIEHQFIDASLAEKERKAKRRRNIMMGLSAFSGVTLVLSLLAGWQWQVAVQQKQKAEQAQQKAEKQQQIAEKRQQTAKRQSIHSQAEEAHALYLSGSRVESLIQSLYAYQQVQNNSALKGNEFMQIFRNVAQFMYPSQKQMVNIGKLQHQGWVNHIAFSSQGNTIASASKGGTVKLWNRQGKLLQRLSHQDAVHRVAFSSQGNTIVSASGDKTEVSKETKISTVKFWNRQGKLIHTLAYQEKLNDIAFSPNDKTIVAASDENVTLWNHQGDHIQTLSDEKSFYHVAFSPDGQTIAAASSDGHLKLWNRQGKLLQTLSHQDRFVHVTFSSNGQTIAAASSDGTVKLWNRQGKLLQTFPHQNKVLHVAFSPDGDTIAAATNDETVKLWNRQGELVQTLPLKDWVVVDVAFSPDGETIACASKGGTVKLWNREGELVQTLPHQERKWVTHVKFLPPQGEIIASAGRDQTVQLWYRQGELVQPLKHESAVNHVAFSPDGDIMASASKDNTANIWNRQGKLLQTLKHNNNVNHVAFSPNSNTIASASDGGAVKLWNRQGKLLRTLEHEDSVYRVAFSPNGETIASASKDKTVKLWNRQGKLLQTLPHENEVVRAAFSPDGNIMASASANGNVKLWNRQGKLQQTLSHEGSILHVAFSPDGETIAVASGDKVKLWNRQGELLQTLPHEKAVVHVAFSPDGNTIASASGNGMTLWNRQGKELKTPKGEGGVLHVAFSPNGNTIASVSGNSVQFWNRQGELLHTLEHKNPVRHVAFSPDGNTIASASEEGTVKVLQDWKTGDELIQQGCQWLQNYVNPDKKNWKKNLTMCNS